MAGRPAETPPILLADLDPKAIAAEVCRLVIEHLHSVAMRLDMHVQLRLETDGAEPGALGLGPTVQALTQFAQRGLPVWDWTHTGMASDACLDVFAALYSAAGTPEIGGGITDMVDEVDPSDEIGTMLLAAFARIRIDQRGEIAPRELAVLAGVSSQYVRHLVRTGELEACPGRQVRVPAKDAKRWLAARGVPGFG